jgi:hypothetical protein
LEAFYRDIIKWDIMGLDACYERMIQAAGELSGILGLDEKLIQVYRRLEKFDAVLRAADVTYREHFLHQFQVFVLGYCVINHSQPLQALMIECLESSGVKKADLDDVVTCWFVTAIFHDLATSIERIDAWLGSYIEVLFPPYSRPGWANTPNGKMISELNLGIRWGNLLAIHSGVFDYHKNRLGRLLSQRLQAELARRGGKYTGSRLFVAKLTNESTMKHQDHGFYGSLILMHMLEDQLSDPLIGEAALAVSVHCPHVYTRIREELQQSITVRGFPFAFLLVYCDSAQQWGRPRFVELFGNEKIHLKQIELSADGGFNIHLKYPRLTKVMREKMYEPWENWENWIDIGPSNRIYFGIDSVTPIT